MIFFAVAICFQEISNFFLDATAALESEAGCEKMLQEYSLFICQSTSQMQDPLKNILHGLEGKKL